MLQAIQLECTRGPRPLFSGLDFELRRGERLYLTGSNGSGKTSLMRILCGLLTPDGGEVLWNGAPIRSLAEDYNRELAYIGHANGVKDELTPLENLRIACQLSGVRADDTLGAALQDFGLAGYERAPVKTLSQGQRRRAALARLAISERQPLWLLDEPFAALDKSAVAHLEQLIATHREQGGMVVMTSHEPPQAEGPGVKTVELLGRAA